MKYFHNIGELVRHIRTEMGYSKRGFAAHIGCSIPTVTRWESEDSRIDAERLISLVQMYGEARTKTATVVISAHRSPPIRLVEVKKKVENSPENT